MTGRLPHAPGFRAAPLVAAAIRRRPPVRSTTALAIAVGLTLPTAHAWAGWGLPPTTIFGADPGNPAADPPPATPAPDAVPDAAPDAVAAGAVPTPSPSLPAPSHPAVASPSVDAPLKKDELAEAGYLPGYRVAKSLSLSPYAPQVGSIPGGVTPAFGAPTPPSNWSFKWNGFLSASMQASLNKRQDPLPGQSKTVFHVPAQTLDEYASFVGTGTMPGTWAALNFEYGNQVASAVVSINTWNPSQPSTYYQIGSQYFINNAYLTLAAPQTAGIGVHATFGYLSNTYGSLSQYGLGMYQNSIIGSPRGIGGTILAEYAIDPSVSIFLEEGFLGNRNGKAPGTDPQNSVVGTSDNGGKTRTPLYPSTWVQHLHLGVIKKGTPIIRAQLHHMINWAQDDRSQMATDDPTTRQIDESYIRDGSIKVYGIDASVSHPVWGYLGAAASFIKGQGDLPYLSLLTYGGDGVSLTDKWWGGPAHGTGTLAVAGFNYSVSLGKIVAGPTPFNGDGPDLLISTGFVVAKSTTAFDLFDRTRHKYGLDVLYKFLPWLAAGIRGDRVVPTSRDSGETFHVIAPRLVFKSDWQSRETVTLVYAKWFYGPRTHSDGGSSTGIPVGSAPGRIDDQLIALNVNIWW